VDKQVQLWSTNISRSEGNGNGGRGWSAAAAPIATAPTGSRQQQTQKHKPFLQDENSFSKTTGGVSGSSTIVISSSGGV
jgi:hypothetical protein